MGGDQILAELHEHLGVGDDEVPPPDGKVSLEHVECNAACDYAPVMMVNWEFFDNMTPERGPGAGRRPARRDPVPPDPRPATAVHLAAGVPDPRRLRRRPGHEGPAAGPATLAGLRIAEEHGWKAPDPAPARAPDVPRR